MTLLAVLLASMAAEAPPDFDAFFEEFKAKRDGIRVLEADFIQRTILPDEVLTSRGTLLYAKPRRIVYRTQQPHRATLIDGRRGYEYEPDIKQLVIYDLEDRPEADIFFLGFDDDTEALREAYDVNVFTIEGEERGSQGIVVRPKDPAAADAYFVEVSLYLRDEDYLPYRIRIVNDEESQVITEVQDIEVNHDPAPVRTQISLAPGTKIIENDTVVEVVGEEWKEVPEPLHFGPDTSEEAPGLIDVAPLPETTAPETAP